MKNKIKSRLYNVYIYYKYRIKQWVLKTDNIGGYSSTHKLISPSYIRQSKGIPKNTEYTKTFQVQYI